MSIQLKVDPRPSIRVASAIASIVAAATPVTLHTIPATRTCKVRKIHFYNHNAAASVVQIGTGLAGLFAQIIPPFMVLAGAEYILEETSIICAEANGNLTCQASVAAAAPANVEVMVEVEEFEGTSA